VQARDASTRVSKKSGKASVLILIIRNPIFYVPSGAIIA
jgi:hypothetical protein